MQFKKILDRSNVVVAGGAGFIGSHLCDALVKEANVICIDNFITGQEENIDLLLKNPYFKFIKHDLREPINLDAYPELDVFKVKYQGVEQIYNLACPTSPRDYYRLPIETLETSALGTKNLLDLAFGYKAKFLLASSSSIYGEPKDSNPYTEDYWGYVDPVGSRSCYNEGKRFAESLAVTFGEHKGLEVKIARIFNTYGPRLKINDGRLIPDFAVRAMTNQDITIFSSPDLPATFCYVSDMVDGLIKLMNSEEKGVFNLGNPEIHNVGEIATKIITLIESKSTVNIDPSIPPYIVRQAIPSIDKIKERVGWFPLISLEQGLKQTIDYLKAHKSILGVKN